MKTWTVSAPLTASWLAPGPVIVKFWVMAMALARVMGADGGQETEKVIVSPAPALLTAPGRDPAPELLQLETVKVAAPATCAGRSATEAAASTVARVVTTSRGARPDMTVRRAVRGRDVTKGGVAAQNLSVLDLFIAVPSSSPAQEH